MEKAMPEQRPTNLVWMDLEMTGLDPQTDRILEIATLVTDANLEILAEGPVLAIHQPDAVLAGMDAWNQEHHSNSGLIDRVRASRHDEAQAEEETLSFLRHWCEPAQSPLCGNSICQDRRFLARWMPQLVDFVHYRNLDVSSLKILGLLWAPAIVDGYQKQGRHRALDDIKESIDELRHYREQMLKI